jgi:hypothetical protein
MPDRNFIIDKTGDIAMPEHGVNDRNFSRPTTKSLRGPIGNRPGGRRPRIPREYAEFRLEDGRYLGEVLEPDFFGPESGHVTKQQREELRVGNYAPARYGHDKTDRFLARAGQAISEGDNDAQFVNLPFGPEEGGAGNTEARFPVARPRPAEVDAEDQDSARGFRMFDLPLTTEGAVDTHALVAGSAYRIPDSAGGGAGQWKGGAFYNFDGKADWNFRSAADLDAYSGASDGPTPEERAARRRTWIKSGGDFSPAVFLEEPDIANFNSKNSEGIRAVQGDDEISFSLGEGPVFLTLPDDAAAVLVRNWDEFKPRLKLLSQLFAENVSPEEMRRRIEAEVYRGIPLSERAKPSAINPDGMTYVSDDPYGGQRFIADLRMRAFDEMIKGIRDGATDEELAGLIGEFQKVMLPELLGASRLVSEFVKDMVPGLNNVRSGIHFWNDLIEIEEEWKEGDILGLAGNSAFLLLDGLGMVPIVGSAFTPVRSAAKKGARALGKALPRLDALVAQAQVWKHARQWSNLDHKIDPSRIFGEAFDRLPRNVQDWVRMKTNFAMGHAANEYLRGVLRRMDPRAAHEVRVQFPAELGRPLRGPRTYDMVARRATAILVEDIMGGLARRLGRRWDNFRASWEHYEFKSGKQTKSAAQRRRDEHAMANPGTVGRPPSPVTNIRDIRIFPEQIPMEFALADAEERLGELVEKGIIDMMTSRMLLDAMEKQYKRGTRFIGLFDYAGLFVNLLAAGGHRAGSAPAEEATNEGSY